MDARLFYNAIKMLPDTLLPACADENSAPAENDDTATTLVKLLEKIIARLRGKPNSSNAHNEIKQSGGSSIGTTSSTNKNESASSKSDRHRQSVSNNTIVLISSDTNSYVNAAAFRPLLQQVNNHSRIITPHHIYALCLMRITVHI
jgi:hypothetical protein